MKKHICRQCGSTFEYCRGCLLSPIPHMDAGFCSKECYEASKINVVEPEIIEESAVVEELEQVEEIIEDVTPIEAETFVEVEAGAIVSEEIPGVQPTFKNETYNTYKKKKNKYQVHE